MMMIFDDENPAAATLMRLQQVLAIHYDDRITSFDNWFHRDD